MTSYTLESLLPHLPGLYPIEMISEVGSHLWGMDHAVSDHDIFVAYSVPIERRLRGEPCPKTLPSKHAVDIDGVPFDFQYIETEHLVHLLQKGNVNAIWAVLSPLNYKKTEAYKDLESIIRGIQRTTAIVPSSVGMTNAQLLDMEKRVNVRDPTKSLRCAYRTIQFAANHLMNQKWTFDPAPEGCTVEDVQQFIEFVKKDAEVNPVEMPKFMLGEWLYNTRMDEIELIMEQEEGV